MVTVTHAPPFEQEICTLELCLPGSWPYQHVHCSGCDDPIVFEGDKVDPYNLPSNADRCAVGHAKHRDCACSPSVDSVAMAGSLREAATELRAMGKALGLIA